MATIDINGTSLYYERTGQGPAILFVHGMCGDAAVWAEQARRLCDRYTCVRYDRRGHTRSARGDTSISAALHADDTAALIEALDLAPCLLVGSSSGAAICVDVLLRFRDLARAAVLSEPPLFSLDPAASDAAMRDLRPVVERAVASGDHRAFVDAFFALMCPGLWEMLGEDTKDRYRANGNIGFTDLRSPSVEVSTGDLAAIDVPVLVIAGDRSHPSLRAFAHLVATSIGDARYVELADCGHVTYAEQPDAFANAVSAFAAESDRRAPTGKK